MAKSSSRKVSSDRMSSVASKALNDGRTSKTTKSLAGSVLSQSRANKKK
ncbi:hypothetical protein [Paenibacillus sp. GP183]|nr:hypothetical protein [Paenibacillus sp. GP183]SEB46417.1 hypothetical protein SAMN05443246_0501 [Paenibacillus sp. GP183]